MKSAIKISLGALVGGLIGLALPWAVALLDLFPVINGGMPYETMMDYMFSVGILGLAVGGLWAFRRTRERARPK